MPDTQGFPRRYVGPSFKSADVPLSVQRDQRKKDRQKKLEEAYAVVNKRDGNKCRATGVRLSPLSVEPKHRREHHHLRGRRVRPEWRDQPERICLLSAFVHNLVTKGWIVVEGTDARKPLFFHWTDLATSHPIQLKRFNPKEPQGA